MSSDYVIHVRKEYSKTMVYITELDINGHEFLRSAPFREVKVAIDKYVIELRHLAIDDLKNGFKVQTRRNKDEWDANKKYVMFEWPYDYPKPLPGVYTPCQENEDDTLLVIDYEQEPV